MLIRLAIKRQKEKEQKNIMSQKNDADINK